MKKFIKVFKHLFFYLLFFVSFEVVSIEQSKFLLITGPSGVGKSTVISGLKQLDPRFVYVTPYTTRKLRNNEKDKVSISLNKMKELNKDGKLLAINNIYDIYYGTPKDIIDDALKNGNFPVLDWPIEKIEIMKKYYGNKLYVVYLEPDNINELKVRLSVDDRDNDGKRLQAGQFELEKLFKGTYTNEIDLKLINSKQKINQTVSAIYNAFTKACNNKIK